MQVFNKMYDKISEEKSPEGIITVGKYIDKFHKIITIDKHTHNITSASVKVRIEVEPNSVEQTSPDRFDDVEKIFIIK